MRGWLLDTNVVATLINPRGAPSVKTWATGQDEEALHISVLTLAEYDKGIHNLPDNHADRPRYIAARDALAERFGRRVLSLGDEIVRRWGRISGEIKRESGGHAPPVIDTLLAATAIEHDLYFVTRNVKDTRPSGAFVFDPWNDDAAKFPLSPPVCDSDMKKSRPREDRPRDVADCVNQLGRLPPWRARVSR